MDDSFYYFFSATPQVLAATLALFGVFVIFKIETIKTQLLALKDLLLNLGREIQKHTYPPLIKEVNDRIKSIGEIRPFVTKLVDSKNMGDEEEFLILIDQFIELTNDQGIKSLLNELINISISKYKKATENRDMKKKEIKYLRTVTIKWSIFTASLIILCLTILSLENYFYCYPLLLPITYCIIIGLIIVCFSSLIYILKKSLEES